MATKFNKVAIVTILASVLATPMFANAAPVTIKKNTTICEQKKPKAKKRLKSQEVCGVKEIHITYQVTSQFAKRNIVRSYLNGISQQSLNRSANIVNLDVKLSHLRYHLSREINRANKDMNVFSSNVVHISIPS